MTLTREQEQLKLDPELLKHELEMAGARFKTARACTCPFHDDRNPSAGIFLGDDGTWRFKCQGCGVAGDIFDIRAKVAGTTPVDELKRVAGTTTTTKPAPAPVRVFLTMDALLESFPNYEAAYRYSNPDTRAVDLLVIRWVGPDGRKKFTQCSPTAGGWWMKQPQGPLPIYNRIRIRDASVVIVVEGEKCVHALHDAGFIATTTPQGAGKASLADLSPLSGKTVYLWPDADPANPPEHAKPGARTGIDHMRDVQRLLQQLPNPPVLYWIDCDELALPPKGDAFDYLQQFADRSEKHEAVQAVLGDAKPIGIAADYAKEMELVRTGKRRSLWVGPHPLLSLACRALMPGTVTCICGDPGSGKSLFLMECLVAWVKTGVAKACIFELEDDRTYHLRRAHAQVARQSGITDNDWVEQNSEVYAELQSKHMQDLNEIGRCIWERPQEANGVQVDVDLDMLAAWVEQRAMNGFDIIAIDPITAAATSEKPWIADLKFINRVKATASKYGTRVILVTHPKQSSGKPGVHSMAGGAAYPRFAHTVLWIERNEDEDSMTVRTGKHDLLQTLVPNRVVKVTKARNGPGAGKRIAFEFEPESLTFKELGKVEKL